jgi:hypothetical protein
MVAESASQIDHPWLWSFYLAQTGIKVVFTALCGYLFQRICRALPDFDRTIRWALIIHALLILGSWIGTNHFDFLLKFRVWTIMALTWLTWPTLLIFRRAWSIRNGIYVLIGFLLLSPCVSRAASFACYAFGYWRTPTVNRPTIEQSENLGYGFSVIGVAEDQPGGMDTFLQTKCLYFRGTRLAPVWGYYSVSPGGCMVAYQNGLNARICVFSKRYNATTTLVQVPLTTSVLLFAWDLPGRTVSAFIMDSSNGDRSPAQWVKFPLPKG